MPFKSRAQQGYMHWLESKGKLPKSVNLNEWDEASKGKKLPQHLWEGGGVDMDHPGDEGLDYSPNNSSGEPHTNEKLQADQNMEYMFAGGIMPGEHGEESYPFARIGDQQPDPSLDEDEDYTPAGTGRSKFAKGGMVSHMFTKALKNRR